MSDNDKQMEALFPEVALELHRLREEEKKYGEWHNNVFVKDLLDVTNRVCTYDATLATIFRLYKLFSEEDIDFARFDTEMYELKEVWRAEGERY